VASSIEETGVALSALGGCDADEETAESVARGARWLIAASDRGRAVKASPLGLYFARLWYYEELYPLIFAIEGLSAASARRFSEKAASATDAV
jgi:squalene-hopene/tetraprenyl-beta-curcumene cyclase